MAQGKCVLIHDFGIELPALIEMALLYHTHSFITKHTNYPATSIQALLDWEAHTQARNPDHLSMDCVLG